MIRSLFLILFAFVLAFSIPSPSFAKDDVKVGDAIPHDLNAKDQTGKMRSFADLKGSKGMTLVFIRSVEWCPFCQKQLLELNKNAKKFSDAGYPVVSVSYDGLKQIEKFVTKNKPTITLLSDPASDIIRAFGILNEASAKGTMSYGIPHPGVYIVSKDKKVQAKFFKKGYKDRPSVNELLAEIKKLNPPPAPNYLTLDEMGSDPIIEGEDVIEIPEKILEPVKLPNEQPAEIQGGLKALEGSVSDVPAAVEKKIPEVIAPKTIAPEIKLPEAISAPDMAAPEGLAVPDMPDFPAVNMPHAPVPAPLSAGSVPVM